MRTQVIFLASLAALTLSGCSEGDQEAHPDPTRATTEPAVQQIALPIGIGFDVPADLSVLELPDDGDVIVDAGPGADLRSVSTFQHDGPARSKKQVTRFLRFFDATEVSSRTTETSVGAVRVATYLGDGMEEMQPMAYISIPRGPESSVNIIIAAGTDSERDDLLDLVVESLHD